MTPGSKSAGEWDSIHVFEATDRARMSHYKLTSTVILHLANETESLGDMDLSGNMTRQIEVDLPVDSDASHVANVGRLVEDMELKMRNLLRMSCLVYGCRLLCADWSQRRCTLAKLRMSWASFEVNSSEIPS